MNSRNPLEHDEARWLGDWVRLHEHRFPELAMLFKIANEGDGNMIRGIRLKQELLRAGVPDYFLPVQRSHAGLFLELKRRKGGRTSAEQQDWADRLIDRGYAVALCAGWEQAAETLIGYLGLPLTVGETTREPEPEVTRSSVTRLAKPKPFSPKTQRPAKVLPRAGETA